jgi:putative ABC transport system permease protein
MGQASTCAKLHRTNSENRDDFSCSPPHVRRIGQRTSEASDITARRASVQSFIHRGATERNVQSQFLTEAVVLSLIGGAIGIVFGMGASDLITKTLGWVVLVFPLAILTAVVFSLAVGIFFGFYPARKAACLNPIEVLR